MNGAAVNKDLPRLHRPGDPPGAEKNFFHRLRFRKAKKQPGHLPGQFPGRGNKLAALTGCFFDHRILPGEKFQGEPCLDQVKGHPFAHGSQPDEPNFWLHSTPLFDILSFFSFLTYFSTARGLSIIWPWTICKQKNGTTRRRRILSLSETDPGKANRVDGLIFIDFWASKSYRNLTHPHQTENSELYSVSAYTR